MQRGLWTKLVAALRLSPEQRAAVAHMYYQHVLRLQAVLEERAQLIASLSSAGCNVRRVLNNNCSLHLLQIRLTGAGAEAGASAGASVDPCLHLQHQRAPAHAALRGRRTRPGCLDST